MGAPKLKKNTEKASSEMFMGKGGQKRGLSLARKMPEDLRGLQQHRSLLGRNIVGKNEQLWHVFLIGRWIPAKPTVTPLF